LKPESTVSTQGIGAPDKRQKVLLVGVVLSQADSTGDGTLDELAALADTAGMMVLDRFVQRREGPDARYFVGKGKAQEIADLCERLEIDAVLFDHELSPAQARNLEKLTNAPVLTRTEVILHIFAGRARTRQARLQVELAQLKYEMPRLRRMWTHLSRIEGGVGRGGVGAGRGPGETQLEVDRRASRKRVHELERSLEQIQRRKETETGPRKEQFTIALVGYTNVGKSSLMNALTGTGAFVEDRLFATLDATTRLLTTPRKQSALLTDTVGFIRSLPHDLVASFQATLEEVREADLLLHVADATSEQLDLQMAAVREVLTELGCHETPTLTVLNKADRLPEAVALPELRARYDNAVVVSAHTGFGLDELLTAVDERMAAAQAEVRVRTGPGDGRLRAYLAEHGTVLQEEYSATQTTLDALVGPRVLGRLRQQFPDARITEIRNSVAAK
jgi:GTP-binding protein HflX